MSTREDVDAAVSSAERVSGWSRTPIKERVQVFYKYKTLLEKHIDELSALVSEENGKVASEARAEILKAAELCEFACSLPQIAPGEVLEVSRGVECRIERYPVGVVAAITPVNFPNMVPNWSLPNAIALGNCLILKPAELVPLSAGRIAELLREAGLPDGVFQVVHGGRETVEALCDHSGIAAISFVGSTKVAKVVYRRGRANLKRVLALGGAKNHLIVMPDADVEMASSNIVASMSGCAGQRCMAASVMVAVSKVDHIIARMIEHAKNIVPGRDIGPVISLAAKARIERYITEAEDAARRCSWTDGAWWSRAGERLLHWPDDHRSGDAGHAHRAGRGVRSRTRHRQDEDRGRGDRGGESVTVRNAASSSRRAAASRDTSWIARARDGRRERRRAGAA
jgi:malonate-semialdehyde dehydrogenase (acetylating)/methylmalonate-semialdehyde dehydrogenase